MVAWSVLSEDQEVSQQVLIDFKKTPRQAVRPSGQTGLEQVLQASDLIQ